MRHLLDSSRLDEAAEYAWSLYLYLWIDGLLGAVRTWMTELLARAERDGIPLAPRTEAIALYFTRAVAYWQDPGVDVLPGLQSSAALFDESGDPAERRPRTGLGRARATCRRRPAPICRPRARRWSRASPGSRAPATRGGRR